MKEKLPKLPDELSTEQVEELLLQLAGLYTQATVERSHYYTGALLMRVMGFVRVSKQYADALSKARGDTR